MDAQVLGFGCRGDLSAHKLTILCLGTCCHHHAIQRKIGQSRERGCSSQNLTMTGMLSPPLNPPTPPKNCPVSAQEIVRGDRYCPTLSGILVPTHLPFLKAPFGEIVTVCLRINLLLADLESDSLLKGGGQRCPPCPAMRCVLAATAGGQPLPIALPPRCASSILSVIAGRPPHHTDERTHNPAHMRTAPQPKLYTAHHHIHICD